MTNLEILEKAIHKAETNGWKPESIGLITIIAAGWLQHDYYKAIIFNHQFAKALWGEKPNTSYLKAANLIPWKYYLQQMVIAKDPIAYLGQNI